ncbi:MAG: hypothetical protein M3O86_02840, partial [Actinomycetota bacterium]|nr:hypothetical protein [Actinomycetota bacterium]
MPVAIVASVVGLVAVLIAYYRDSGELEAGPPPPDWALLPSPGDLARVDFPLTFPGYDLATVDLYFETLARAYGDLLAVAPPEVVARARVRTALRLGLDPDAVDGPSPASDAAFRLRGAPLAPDT